MPVIADLVELEWCASCGRLLTLSTPEDDCQSEHCPGRIEAADEYEREVLEVSGPAYNKGTEVGWH